MIDVDAAVQAAIRLLVAEEAPQHAAREIRIGEPAELVHVTLSAVGDGLVKVADPFAPARCLVVANARRDGIQPKPVPPIPVVALEVGVGAPEARCPRKEIVPPPAAGGA